MTERERLIELLMQGDIAAAKQGVFNCCMCRREAETIADYLLENGVIILPCKIGDDLYWISDENEVECQRNAIVGIVVKDGCFEALDIDGNIDKIGTRYAYLSREEAEKALKESEDNA